MTTDTRARRRAVPLLTTVVIVFLTGALLPVRQPAAGRAAGAPGEAPGDSPVTLWYRQPAAQWVEALPIGNGRLGAMVFGGIEHERLQLNEDTLWAGGPYDPSHSAARDALPRVRALIAAGRFAEAETLITDQMLARPSREMPYQTVGDLTITMAASTNATDYRRSLDLDTAIARTTFRIGNVRYTREVFASPVDQGHAPQHRSLAEHGARRRPSVGNVADGRRLAGHAPVGTLSLLGRSGVPGAGVPADEGRCGVLPGHAGARPQRAVPDHESVDFP